MCGMRTKNAKSAPYNQKPTANSLFCLVVAGYHCIRISISSVETTMFGSLGKQFAGDIASQVQSTVKSHLDKRARDKGSTEKATEALGQVTGRRKALFIGINYYGQNGELKGCINDVHNIKKFLSQNYHIDEMLILTDDQTSNPSKMPTRKNILAAFKM